MQRTHPAPNVATVLGCKYDLLSASIRECLRVYSRERSPALKFHGARSARINKMYREKLVAHEENEESLASTRRIKYSQLHE